MVRALVPKARSTKLFGFLFPALPAQSVFSHPQRDTEVLAVVDFKETGPDGKQGCGGQWRRRGRHGWRSLRPGGDEGIGKQAKLEGRWRARPCWTRSAMGRARGRLFCFYLWTAGELPKGLGERLEQVSVESCSLCLLSGEDGGAGDKQEAGKRLRKGPGGR